MIPMKAQRIADDPSSFESNVGDALFCLHSLASSGGRLDISSLDGEIREDLEGLAKSLTSTDRTLLRSSY